MNVHVLRGTSYDGIISIADWYGVLSELAGASLADLKAESANSWLRTKGLPLLPPVDSVPGLVREIFSGNNRNLRQILHLSEFALIDWPYKLVLGSQPYSLWTGELFPNCSKDAVRPWFVDFKILDAEIPLTTNKTAVSEKEVIQSCAKGCLFDIEADPYEYKDLSTNPVEFDRLQQMKDKLAKLNEGLFEPLRGDVMADACTVSLKNGGFHGPFINVENFYTGPFPHKSFAQRIEDQIYAATVNTLNVPLVKESVIEVSKKAMKYLGPKLVDSFNTCEDSNLFNEYLKELQDTVNNHVLNSGYRYDNILKYNSEV